MINKCACGCNPQQGKLNINSNLNKDFNKVIKSPNQSDLNKQLLLQQVNKKPGSISPEGTDSVSLPNDLVLSQLKELNSEVDTNTNSITDLQQSVSDLDSDITSINNKLNNFSSLKFQKVSLLPTTDISENIIYLTPVNNTGEKNYYDEYVYIDGKWELIGTTKFDVSEATPHIGENAPLKKMVWLDTNIEDEIVENNQIAYGRRIVSNDEELTFNELEKENLLFNEVDIIASEELIFNQSNEEQLIYNE